MWKVEPFNLERVGLLVGKNATGKTRTLNTLFGIARLLTGQLPLSFESGHYHLEFSDDTNQESAYQYELQYENKSVLLERFVVGTKVRLNRGSDGTGTIYAEKLGQDLDFQIANNQLAATAKRDLAQHTYLEHLNVWAQSVRVLRLGRQHNLAVSTSEASVDSIFSASAEPVSIAAAFIVGEKTFGQQRFSAQITKYMNDLDYPIKSIEVIDLGAMKGVVAPTGLALQILAVKEDGVNVSVDQSQMSAGMFRALDILVHVQLAKLQDRPFLLLIDDIGEGLDYARSSALVRLLVRFVNDSDLQVLMTTNDRFVMNNVPLKFWSVVNREGGTVHVFNVRNSADRFKEFEDMGLNNFDFFSRKVFLKG